ncbi:BBM_1a_G0016490.mRNA.1.CDS.1 [Saccharomyces cerevisiae]|nr:BBM_1a_G0016490.mRNA.1.CDS.1 [Saccharomyces cerevisiae]CAI7106645.1 BBM_1a_G0016490.mRNA.1.CDS.1 [Saccharomyces cerevisiae]
MSVATAANLLWSVLIGFSTPFITSAINLYYGYVFMGYLTFSYFYIFFFVPETKGLSLEEADEMWMGGVLPWKSTSWIPASRKMPITVTRNYNMMRNLCMRECLKLTRTSANDFLVYRYTYARCAS